MDCFTRKLKIFESNMKIWTIESTLEIWTFESKSEAKSKIFLINFYLYLFLDGMILGCIEFMVSFSRTTLSF